MQHNLQHSSQQLGAWLNNQSRHFSSHLNALFFYSAVRFVSTSGMLYLLAQILGAAVIEKHAPSILQMSLLAVAMIMVLICHTLISNGKLVLAEKVIIHYQQALTRILSQHSLAVIRDLTLANWQSTFINRIPALQQFFTDYLPQKRIAYTLPLLVLAIVFPISWLAAMLLAIAAPLIPLFMWLVGKGAAQAQQNNFIALDRLNSFFLDRLRARQMLHIHNAIESQKKDFISSARRVKERTLDVLRLAFLSSSVLDFFSTLGIALVAVFVGFSLLGEIQFGSWHSGLSLSEGLFILLIAPLFFSELKSLGRYYHFKAEAIGAADTIFLLLDSDISNTNIHSTRSFKLPIIRVVTTENKIALDFNNLYLKIGERVLLQGDSGTGKTTLLEALLGMRTEGLNKNNIIAWQKVGWLQQQPVITAGTVRENITRGNEASDTTLYKLLQHVELEEWLTQLPQKFDTPMGDYPALSGGQRQRLAIARLLFFDKPIIFLDEPTANLSIDQSQRISQLIKHHFRSKTLIWVSHELEADNFFTTQWTLERQAYSSTSGQET